MSKEVIGLGTTSLSLSSLDYLNRSQALHWSVESNRNTASLGKLKTNMSQEEKTTIDDNGNSLLHLSIIHNNLNAIGCFINEFSIDFINGRNNENLTAVLMAYHNFSNDVESLLAAGAEIAIDKIKPYKHLEYIKYGKNYDETQEPDYEDFSIDWTALDDIGLIDLDQLERDRQQHCERTKQHDKNDKCIKVANLVDEIYSGSEITKDYVEIINEHPELYDLFSSRLVSHIMNRGMIEGYTDIKNYLESLSVTLPKDLINMIPGKLIDKYIEHDYGKQIPGQNIPDILGVDEEIRDILKDQQIQKSENTDIDVSNPAETSHATAISIAGNDQDANIQLVGQHTDPVTESIS